LHVGEAERTLRVPIVKRTSPALYASTRDGCLLNAQLTGADDVFVTGEHFHPGETLEISMVANQRGWSVGDPIFDLTGPGFHAAPRRVTVAKDGRFTVKVWDRADQRRGAYDVVAHRPEGREAVARVGKRDIVSYGAETGFILYLRYPVGGPTMDIAGRPLAGSPYFEFADSFADSGDAVWGAVDPTYVPSGHSGGTYAAYYVVNHRSVTEWDPAAGGSTDLVDVSGGVEIHPVKAGCVNGTDVVIWNGPVNGKYDVVVDFGSVAAATPATYVTDGHYDEAVDFLDGADQVGFEVAQDPHGLGPFAVGGDSYSQDDFFPTLLGRSNVDLRAVVRYPATAAGIGTPVAPGAHPLFVIEHGNHRSCNVSGYDGDPSYDLLHTGCPDRTQNHMGYMGLLETLASHGVIAVSIDVYDLTGNVPQLNAERSELILKHLELWSHMNDPATFPSYPDFFLGRFAGRVDMGRSAVSGHSRGGEASVGAWVRNAARPDPFHIIAVSSIAPVDTVGHVLGDVPYFVILPAADGDVWNLAGLRIFDRAGWSLSPVDATTKSGIDVYGASHNFFNTIWAADGDDGAPGRDDYIPAGDQQVLGEAFLAAFNRVHLVGEAVYEDALRGEMRFPSWAGRKVYPMRHEKSHAKIESGAGSGAASGGATVTPVSAVAPHQTAALRVGWTAGTAQLTYTLPAALRDASAYEVLSFRVAQTNSADNPATGSQGFMVELVGGGHTKATYSGLHGEIPKPYAHLGLGPSPLFQDVMTTLRIPLHSFILNHAGVTLGAVDTVRFTFSYPGQGEIYVDDIEFSR